MNTKKSTIKYFHLFLILHLVLWTIVPTLSNQNLPLDTIEALAWGSNLDWGFNKHPPFSAFAVEVFYQLFGNQDWAYYFLSQIFVVIAFYFVFKFANEFSNNLQLSFLSVLLLEAIYFYNYTTPEFNVNVSQLPFWALTVFFTWRCIKSDKILNYIFLGIVISLGILSKYLFLYLVLSVKLLFIYLMIKRKKIFQLNLMIPGAVVLLITFPHLNWLIENDFITLKYGFERSGGIGNLSQHLIHPLSFVFKQFLLLIPFFILLFFLTKKIKFKKLKNNERIIFLFFTCLLPIIFMFLTSVIIGAKIRTMWMTPFYLFFGIFFIEVLKESIDFKKIKRFYYVFIFLFFLSPITYFTVSTANEFKRTDYPGKEIARLVQNKWDDNFSNEINVVVGDEWFAGNLSYHLSSRPQWIIDLKGKTAEIKKGEGVIYTGNPKILKKICPGVYGTIKPVGYCMIGKR